MKSGKKLLEECVRMILLLAAVSIVADTEHRLSVIWQIGK